MDTLDPIISTDLQKVMLLPHMPSKYISNSEYFCPPWFTLGILQMRHSATAFYSFVFSCAKENFFILRPVCFHFITALFFKLRHHIPVASASWNKSVKGKNVADVATVFCAILKEDPDVASILVWWDNCVGQKQEVLTLPLLGNPNQQWQSHWNIFKPGMTSFIQNPVNIHGLPYFVHCTLILNIPWHFWEGIFYFIGSIEYVSLKENYLDQKPIESGVP